MREAVYYKGNNKEFSMKRKRLKLKKGAKYSLLTIVIVIFSLFSFFFISNSTSTSDGYTLINYTEKGQLVYKVAYEDAQGFTSGYQPANMTYVANLIDHVNINFNYSLNSFENLDIEYYYEIVSDIFVNNANGSKGVINASSSVIKKSDTFNINEKGFDIIEELDIDYNAYNEEVSDLKNVHGLQITAELILSLNVYTVTKHNDVVKPLESKNELKLSIPLSEQVVDVKLESSKVDNSQYLTDYEEEKYNNKLYAGIIFAVSAALFVIYFVLDFTKHLFNKDVYQSTIKKYLREYDRLIVTSKQPDLDESSFDNKIRVMSIEELIDAHDSSGSPIVYYEVIPNEKSYFIIIDNNTFYKLTISRQYLENELLEKKNKI